jgi:TonB family protein
LVTAPHFSYELPASRRKSTFASSLVLHAVGVVLLVGLFRWLPAPRIDTRYSQATPLYIPAAPAVENPPPKIVPPPPKEPAKLTPPKITIPPPEDLPKTEKLTPFEIARVPDPVVPKPEPKKEIVTGSFATNEVVTPVHVKKDLVTDNFTSGSSAPATLQKPPREVQTGGFGDPNGVKGVSEKRASLTVASVGSFDLPAGAGNGNGTGGTHGAQGTVASAGFGNGVAGPGQGDRRTGSVASTSFTQVAAATPAPKTHADDKPNMTPVEILYKPVPVYTAEARQIHLEGEVLVRVTFLAAGDLRVEQVVRGLGHGLDEAALRAAQQIKFRPAQRDGQPYDSTALVHIVFELAN